ncbi:MAG: type II toxin-antitoxin system Phd/YefM family antitoxin [Campylobacterales bacterium]|nr:type II toxin-antitoxin system Phd/YefM family antitoxin [Campylobacterales bacterium]
MVAYTQQELVGVTELAKSLGGFLDKVVSHSVEKIAIVRHNKPEAVIVPIAEYERMKELAMLVEELEIASIIAARDPEGSKEGTFDFDTYHEQRMKRRGHVSA